MRALVWASNSGVTVATNESRIFMTSSGSRAMGLLSWILLGWPLTYNLYVSRPYDCSAWLRTKMSRLTASNGRQLCHTFNAAQAMCPG